MGEDLLLADIKSFLLALLIVLGGAAIVLRGNAHQRTQRLDHLCVVHIVVAFGAGGKFQPLAGFYDDVVAGTHQRTLRVKVIRF